jgi:surface antigen
MPRLAIAFLATLYLLAFPFNANAVEVPSFTVCGSKLDERLAIQYVEVLQATIGGYSFDVACQAHDACYEDCRTPKPDCDKKFLSDAEGVCDSARLKQNCIAYAHIAFQMVSEKGDMPFRQARANCSGTAQQSYPDAGTGAGGGGKVGSGDSSLGRAIDANGSLRMLISAPGTDFGSAGLTSVGSVTEGQLKVPRGQNYFRFTPQQDANYVIYTRGSTNTDGELYDDRFKRLDSDCCGGGGQNFRMAKQLEPGRTYYVLVRGQPGPYSLHVDGPESLYSAQEVKVGSVTTGQMKVPRDQNYFRFTPQQDANYVIYTRGLTDTDGELYDDRFKRLDSDCCGGGGQNFRVAKQLEPGRTYYVLVRGQPGPYSLHVDGPESMYSATEVKVGSVTTGQMQVPRDQNYFRFTPQHSANYVIYTRGSTDTDGELYDERFKRLDGDCCGGGGQNFRMAKQLEPGRTYYVLVRGQPGPYSLHVDGPESLYSAQEVKVGTEVTATTEAAARQDYKGFPAGYCTNYAARVFDSFAPSPKQNWRGSAEQWIVAAGNAGWRTSADQNAAREGAIAVWDGGGFGHVAIVKGIEKDASGGVLTIDVSEMNWGRFTDAANSVTENFGKVNSRRIATTGLSRSDGSYRFLGFIFPERMRD